MATEQEIREFEFRRRRELEAGPTAEETVRAGLAGQRSSVGQLAQVAADVGDVGLGAIYGIGQTAARLSNKYLSGETDESKMVPNILGYELHSDGAKQIAKVLGYLPEKAREFLVRTTGREGAGDAMDAAGLVLLGKGGYRGAKTPKAIGAHEHLGAVRVLHDAGVPLTLAERSRGFSAAVAGIASDTLNAIRDSGFKELQIGKFTEAVLNSAGIKGKAAVPEVMGPRAAELGAKFDAHDAAVQTAMDQPFADALVRISDEAALAPENVQGFVKRHTDHLMIQASQNGGAIPGPALSMARTALDKATSDPTVKAFAMDLRVAMDDALERQAPPKLAKEIRETRAGWRDMKAIEDAVRGNPSGLIMPDNLFAAYSTKKRVAGTVYGKGETDLHVLARAGAKVLGTDPLRTSSALAAIPMSAAGIGVAATHNPALALGLGAALKTARSVNENQLTARVLGGRGRTRTSRLPSKTEALGAYYSASTPEARKQALEELKRAHTPE